MASSGQSNGVLAGMSPDLVPKYPACLHVHLEAIPRPEPGVTVTNPAANIRPYLPAGFGSGFETGRQPLDMFLGGVGAGPGGTHAGASGLMGIAKLPSMEEVSRSKYYRPITEGCQVRGGKVLGF